MFLNTPRLIPRLSTRRIPSSSSSPPALPQNSPFSVSSLSLRLVSFNGSVAKRLSSPITHRKQKVVALAKPRLGRCCIYPFLLSLFSFPLLFSLPHLCSIRPHPYSPAYTSTYIPYFTLYTLRTPHQNYTRLYTHSFASSSWASSTHRSHLPLIYTRIYTPHVSSTGKNIVTTCLCTAKEWPAVCDDRCVPR